MKTVKATLQDNPGDTAKLLPLLALATGAAAMPQTSNADIIFNNQGSTVSWAGTPSFIINNLPGDAQLGFQAHRAGSFSVTSVRSVTAGKRGGGYVELKLALVPQGMLWGQISAAMTSRAQIATAQSTVHSPDSFGSTYLAFEFKDSSQAGSPMRYGWVQISLSNGNLITGNDFPQLTISGWAYDNTGAQIPTGAVPEPGSISLLALGALTFGAAGVRSWRRNRAAASTNSQS
jgi:hypothetical protein